MPATVVLAVAVVVTIGSFADVSAGAVVVAFPGSLPARPALPGMRAGSLDPRSEREALSRWLGRLTDVARAFQGTPGPAPAALAPPTHPHAVALPPAGACPPPADGGPPARERLRAHLTDLPPPLA